MTEHFYTSFHNVLESHAFAFPSVPVSCFQSLHPRLLNFSLHFPHVSHCLLISHIISSTVLLQRLYHYYVHVICSPGLYCATQFFLSYFHHCPFTIYHHFSVNFFLLSSPLLTSLSPSLVLASIPQDLMEDMCSDGCVTPSPNSTSSLEDAPSLKNTEQFGIKSS